MKKCDTSDFNSDFVLSHQSSCIESLLEHTRKSVPFYQGLSSSELADYPVVNKLTIKSAQDAFMSSEYNLDSLIRMHTSGSTGTPFVVYQDALKKKKVNAECIYYSRLVGYDVGKPLIYLRSVVKQVQKSKLSVFMQNQPSFQCNDLSDKGIADLLTKIKQYPGTEKSLIAYASTLDSISSYLRRHGVSSVAGCKVTGILSGSEMLYDQTRTEIEAAFGCKCVSRYSNEENGILGQDDEINNVFLINEADYFIEILKFDSDEPAATGEVGRIVVTDLFNYAMPMIRYDTGDIGAMAIVQHNGVSRRAITEFGGRKCDMVFNTKGEQVSPHAITNCFWSFPEIAQFQFIQKDSRRYHILLNCSAEFTRQEEIKARMTGILGEDADIEIEKISDIPVLNSGKRKYIVSEVNVQ